MVWTKKPMLRMSTGGKVLKRRPLEVRHPVAKRTQQRGGGAGVGRESGVAQQGTGRGTGLALRPPACASCTSACSEGTCPKCVEDLRLWLQAALAARGRISSDFPNYGCLAGLLQQGERWAWTVECGMQMYTMEQFTGVAFPLPQAKVVELKDSVPSVSESVSSSTMFS